MDSDNDVGCLIPEGAYAPPERLSDIDSWHGLVPVAFALVELLRPRCFVELGTHQGDSYGAFCQALDTLEAPVTAYAVDTWRGDEHAGLYGEEVYESLRRWHEPRFGHFSRLVRSTFDQALDHFADGSVDLLHIDGLHTEEAVRHDFESWLPKMSARGVVLFHDTNVRERGFGVWRLWEELAARYPAREFPFSHGLGVLCVGEVPPGLAAWFATSEAQWDGLSRRFHALGERVRLLGERDRLLGARDWLKDERDRLQGERDQLSARLGRETEQLATTSDRLQELGKMHSHALSVVEKRDTQLEDCQKELAACRGSERQAQSRLDALERSRAFRLLKRLPTVGSKD